MDLIDIERFLSVAEVKNFSIAAELQNVSQSSLSKSIMRIESELGVQLINRQSRPVSLTEAGAVFYEGLCKIHPMYLKLLRDISYYASRKRLLVYIVPSVINFDMQFVFSNFAEQHPDILLTTVGEDDFLNVAGKMQNKLPNFVIANQSAGDIQGYNAITLFKDEIWVLMPKNHPLAKNKSCTLKDIEDEEIVVNRFSNSVMEYLKRKNNFAPVNVIYHPNERKFHTIMNIQQRNCICLFNASDLRTFNLSSVAVLKLAKVKQPSVVLMENDDNKDKEYCNIFKDYLLDNLYKD